MNVLLIENNNETAQYVKKILNNQSYNVLHLKSHADSINVLKDEDKSFDVILVGIYKLEGDPVEIFKQIRKLRPVTPIIVIFTINQQAQVPHYLKSGAQAAVPQPVDKNILFATIEAQLKFKETGSNFLTSGDLELDLRRQVLKVAGKNVHMTKIEFQILRVLIEQKDSIVSREELTRKVWHLQGDEIFSNVVDVHIRRLRQKIVDHDKKKISAIRGKGYIFNS